MESDQEYSIVGTSSLATCVGFLAYSPKIKKALVTHFSPSSNYLIPQVLEQLKTNGFITEQEFKKMKSLDFLFNKYDVYELNKSLIPLILAKGVIETETRDAQIEIMIIEGFHENDGKKNERIKTLFSSAESIFRVNQYPIPEDAIILEIFSKNEGGNCFYFDASTGQFVTQTVLADKNLNNGSANTL